MASEEWEVQTGGRDYSVALDTLEAWIREGRVQGTDLVRKGTLPWRSVQTTPQLRGVTANPELVQRARAEAMRSSIPAVPTGTRACPACAEQVQAAALKCRYCGTSIPDPEWVRLVTAYSECDAPTRQLYWDAMDDPQRERLKLLLTPSEATASLNRPVAPGALSCPRCSGSAFGARHGCLIALMVITFPLGLLLLLIRPTYTCSSCGYRFAA